MFWFCLICLWVILLAYFKLPRKFVRRFYVPPVLVALVVIYNILNFLAWLKAKGNTGIFLFFCIGYSVLAVVIFIREMRNSVRQFNKGMLQVQGKSLELQGKIAKPVLSAVGGPLGPVVGAVASPALQGLGKTYSGWAEGIETYDQTVYDMIRDKAVELGINTDGLNIEELSQKVISCASKAGVYEITQANPNVTPIELATKLICTSGSK